jgi:hypothetical protein
MSWSNALFVNWFGIKLMIPFILGFINIYLGIIGLMIWSGTYFYYYKKELGENSSEEKGK